MAENTFVELSDRWVLPLHGGEVTRCCVDYRFSLDLQTEHHHLTAAIGTSFTVRVDDREHAFDPESDYTLLGPALSLLHRTVESGTAWRSGRLEIAFADGSALSVEPHPEYEAWEVVFEGGQMLVCRPGGDLAVWQDGR